MPNTTERISTAQARALLSMPGGKRGGGAGRSKFGNVKTQVDGITFDSKLEAARWQELLLEQRAGEVSNLRRQVSYPLVVNGTLVCRYVADFVYTKAGEEIIEDSKGMATDAYRIKKKLMLACHGITIKESRAR